MRVATMVLAILIVSSGAASRAEESGAKRVVVADFVSISPKLEKYRPKMWEAISDAVRESNWNMIRASRNVCTVKECPKDFADRDQAKAVIAIEGNYTSSRFNVTIKLWGSQGWLGEFTSTSELCTAAEFANAVGDGVRKAIAAEAERILNTPISEPKPIPVAKSVPVKPSPVVVTVPKEVPRPPQRQTIWAPWVVVGAGLAVTAAGAWMWSKNGNNTDCSDGVCNKTYKTSTVGIATTSLGIATVLAGGTWYVFSLRDDATVALGPGSINFAGRF